MSDTQEKSRPWKSTRYKKQSKRIFCSAFSVISPFSTMFFISTAPAQTLSLHVLSTELINLLGGPCRHGDAAEDLRDLFPRFKDAEGMGAFSGGGQESRPSQDWQSESLRWRRSSPSPPDGIDSPRLSWFWFTCMVDALSSSECECVVVSLMWQS